MKKLRREQINKAAIANNWGIILGTLGRQGSLKVLDNLEVKFIELFFIF